MSIRGFTEVSRVCKNQIVFSHLASNRLLAVNNWIALLRHKVTDAKGKLVEVDSCYGPDETGYWGTYVHYRDSVFRGPMIRDAIDQINRTLIRFMYDEYTIVDNKVYTFAQTLGPTSEWVSYSI